MQKLRVGVPGGMLHGVLSGTGKPVIFLHAGVADGRMWQEQMGKFGRSVAYDRREFGQTESQDVEFSHVDDLIRLMDFCEIESATLCGASQGGRISIDAALAFPDRVGQLVLVAPAVSGVPRPDITELPTSIAERIKLLDEAEEADDLKRVNEIEAAIWLDGPQEPEGRVQGPARDLFLDMNWKALLHSELNHEIEPPSAWDRLSNINVPTLVIVGDLDFPHVRSRCEELSVLIPNARRESIDGTAHLPNLEKPAHFNQLLQDFLR